MSKLSHLGDDGRARMVDVSAKAPTARTARAEGRLICRAETLGAVKAGTTPKGAVLQTAELAALNIVLQQQMTFAEAAINAHKTTQRALPALLTRSQGLIELAQLEDLMIQQKLLEGLIGITQGGHGPRTHHG